MRLIFCLGGNAKLMTMARMVGWWPGAQLPATVYPVYEPLAFADLDYRGYRTAQDRDLAAAARKRAAYSAAVAMVRPHMAAAVDWEHPEQLPEVLDWARELAPMVQQVMLIPKVVGGVTQLPHVIDGTPVVLGYSIPTTHGGTRCGFREFARRRVHLLGGSPRQQLSAARLLAGVAEVVSVDGNMCHRAAGWGTYWTGRRWANAGPHVTPTLVALYRSLVAIRAMWLHDGWSLDAPPPLPDDTPGVLPPTGPEDGTQHMQAVLDF